MKHKTAELEGALLDAAVAMALGLEWLEFYENRSWCLVTRAGKTTVPILVDAYSSDWAHGGPLIDREPWALPRVNTNPGALHLGRFAASTPGGFDYYGPTPLIAAMRAFVASKLGEEVELP